MSAQKQSEQKQSASSSSLVGRRLGRYEVLAKLASGGMASVYVARAQGVAGFERLVAIKALHANLAHEEEFMAMFLDEARLAARIRHPNVVPTLDISDTVDAGYYLVMEYVEGEHVGRLLSSAANRGERLPAPVTLRIMVDTLGGLSAAHKLTDDSGKCLNLVHRDISPHNILVGVDGIARLTDFGVAKAEDRLTHTREGQIKGKLSYMAPEHASAGRTDLRSDLFSVGTVLWECLTVKRLFRAESAAATLKRLLSEEIQPPSNIAEELKPLDDLVLKALSRDIDKRFQDADSFAEALEERASEVGGMASLRTVGKAVRTHAADKLERDKKRIKEAVELLATSTTSSGVQRRTAEDPNSEVSVDMRTPSSGAQQSVLSVLSSTSNLSKLSGVHMQHTQKSVLLPGARVPPPGPWPPEDSEAISISPLPGEPPEIPGLRPSLMPQIFAGRFRPVWFAALAAFFVVLAAAAFWALSGQQQEQIRVIAITPDQQQTPPTTPPPAAERAEAEGPAVPAEHLTPGTPGTPGTARPTGAGAGKVKTPTAADPKVHGSTSAHREPTERKGRGSSISKSSRKRETQKPTRTRPSAPRRQPVPDDDFPASNPYL